MIRAWTATSAGVSQEDSQQRILGFAAIVRAIAEESPVSPERDSEGNLVGAGLTSVPTPHRFRVKGRDLFVWCALDALFLPGLLGETAEVQSNCPTTGDEIRLTVSPEAEAEYTPGETVLTIVVPGITTPIGTAGPASPT